MYEFFSSAIFCNFKYSLLLLQFSSTLHIFTYILDILHLFKNIYDAIFSISQMFMLILMIFMIEKK